MIKVPPLKVGVYLILQVQSTLFADPTLVTNKGKMKCKNIKSFDQAPFLSSVGQNYYQGDFLSKSDISLPFHEVHLIES